MNGYTPAQIAEADWHRAALARRGPWIDPPLPPLTADERADVERHLTIAEEDAARRRDDAASRLAAIAYRNAVAVLAGTLDRRDADARIIVARNATDHESPVPILAVPARHADEIIAEAWTRARTR